VTYPHTSWRSLASSQTLGNPLEPGGEHGGALVGYVTATGTGNVTVMTVRYGIRLMMWVQPDSSNNPLVGLESAGTLAPSCMVTVAPLSGGPYPNPWPGGQSQVDFVASDFLTLSYNVVQGKSTSGFPTYAFCWEAVGETHGARKVTGPVEAAVLLTLGWNPTNFLANYSPQNPGIGWSVETFLRAKFGSLSPMT
jgi:hypothetical protein